jgi:hypothetical protein
MNKLDYLKPEHLNHYRIKDMINDIGFELVKELIEKYGGEQIYIPDLDCIDSLRKDIVLELKNKSIFQIKSITNYPKQYIKSILKGINKK